MKEISVLGLNTDDKRLFITELAWVMSKENNVFCLIDDKEFFKNFSDDSLNPNTIGNFTLVNTYNDAILENKSDDSIIISENYLENSSEVILIVEQNKFSIAEINKYSDLLKNQKVIIVYLNFLYSNFDEYYFKNFHFNKILLDSIKKEFYFEFDEKTKLAQIENIFNRVISLKKYPKFHKKNLLNLSETLIENKEKTKYREYFKVLDERLSLC